MSIKSTIAAVAASPFLLAGAAFAGPYVNVESNLGYLSESAAFYAQVGPAFVHTDSTDDTETEFSGKVGVTVAATDSLGVYGELAGISAEDSSSDDIINWTAKVGAKFVF